MAPVIMVAMGLTANMADAIICQVAAALANSEFVQVAVGRNARSRVLYEE